MKISDMIREARFVCLAKFSYEGRRGKVPIGHFTIKMKPGPKGNIKFLENSAKTRSLQVARKGDSVLATGDATQISSLITSLAGLNYDVTITDL